MDELLLKSAEEIDGHFTYGEYSDGQGNYCMLGAFTQARRSLRLLSAHKVANDALRKIVSVLPTYPECKDCETVTRLPFENRIVHFNDHHCHGGDEAAKLFREAAELE